MKIENSTVGFASQHASLQQHTVEESLRVWNGNRAAPPLAPLPDLANQTVVSLSDSGRQAALAAQPLPSSPPATSTQGVEETANNAENDPKMQLLIGLIEALTGRKVRLFNPGMLKLGEKTEASMQTNEGQGNPGRGWGIEYSRHESLRESESTSFKAEGVVRTSDGQEIRFSLSLEMKREFVQESSLSIRAGDAAQRKDPLVVNFGGTSAQLTDTKFAFDLDSDGNTEQVSFTGAGSGFLALDKNGNGVIDNGSELFGTQSGNGFADLAAYDSDGNRWIDENDPAYSKLRILTKDAAGKDVLTTLSQQRIGALYLDSIASPFDVKNAANQLLGQVRASGVYLSEDGSSGTLQQIDLAV